MVAVFRVVLCCLWCAGAVLASSPTIDEILASEAVLDDFLNKYGDDPSQHALGAAKGVIENGPGKAYLGEGYWYTYCDAKGSTIQNAQGVDIGPNNFKNAIDAETNCLHLKMSRPDASTSSYVGFGCNLLAVGAYVDLSKMTAFTINLKGTGNVRVNFITKEYLEAKEEWGYFGADLALPANFKDVSISTTAIAPMEWSYGYKNDLTWAANGSKAVNKIQFEVDAGKSADISIKKLTFTGMTYADFGFTPLLVSHRQSARELRNILKVNNSKVTYSVARPQCLSITLFNAMGGRVATLLNGSAEAGSHVVTLPRNAANGSYFVVVDGEQGTVVQNVRIVK